jgi:hypothetical protein
MLGRPARRHMRLVGAFHRREARAEFGCQAFRRPALDVQSAAAFWAVGRKGGQNQVAAGSEGFFEGRAIDRAVPFAG